MLTKSLERQLEEIKIRQATYIRKSKELNTAKIGYYQAAKLLQKDLKRLEEQKQYLYAQLRALQTDKATLDQQAAAMRRSQEDLASELVKVKKMTLESQ
jgi:chromosome segregation ATPase